MTEMSFNGKVKILAGKEFMVPSHGAMSYRRKSYCRGSSSGSFFPFLFLRPGIMEESILFDVDRIRNRVKVY